MLRGARKLVVVRREGSVLDFMRGNVTRRWLPDDVVVIDQMPLIGTGKVHKIRLREQFKDCTAKA